MPPLRASETHVTQQLLLVTTNSQVCKPQTIANIRHMTYRTGSVAINPLISILVICVSGTERGGIKFSTVSAAQEITDAVRKVPL